MIYDVKTFEPGELILKEGEIGKGFCILEDGELQVVRGDKILNEITSRGSMFGELSELLMYKRDASIRAKTKASVKFFNISLPEFVEQNPKFAVKIIRNLGRRLIRMNEIAMQGDARNNILQSVNDSSESSKDQVTRILVVEEKQAIFEQLRESLSKTGWVLEWVSSEDEAVTICDKEYFSAIIVSCSLPDNGAIDLKRKLKTNPMSAKTPVTGLLTKGDDRAKNAATEVGYTAFISKPIEKNKALNTLYDVLNLDFSDQYFNHLEGALYFRVPATLNEELLAQINRSFPRRISSAINDGVDKMVVDVSQLSEVWAESIQLVTDLAEHLEEIENPFKTAFVAEGEDSSNWNKLDGCEDWVVCESVKSAVENLIDSEKS
ncbi:MAG: response regulator [Opitutales bacterium]|nr:response regulator [Verrucomicrobiota bacterium]